MNGRMSDHFTRKVITPRTNYVSSLEKYKVMYHNEAAIEWSFCEYDVYWNELG